MSDEDDCIVISIGEDSDAAAAAAAEVRVIHDFDTHTPEDSLSDDEVLLLLTESEDDSDSPEELPELSFDVEGFAALNSQVVSRLAILRSNPDSEEVESMLLCKKAQLSIPEDDLMNLHELAEIISSHINCLREIVSEIQCYLETTQMLPCGDDNPPLPAERQENDAETNPGGISLQSAASPEVQQLELRESSPLPRIVSAYSLQPNHYSGSPDTRLALLSIFNEGDESTNSDLLSAQHSLAEPIAYLPQAESILPDNFETVRYSTINNSINPDTALPSLCIPPNFETPGEAETSLVSSTETMHYPTLQENGSGQDTVSSVFIPPNFEVAETSLENNPETMSYPTLSGNDSDPSSSSVNLTPSFGVEKFILTQMPIMEETGVENSSQTVYYPALLGSITGLGTGFSYHSAPHNFAVEKVILIEMPGQAETTMDNSCQTVGNETVVGSETVMGNDSDPDTGSSHPSILPSVEMLAKAETSWENDAPVMNQPPFLQYGSDEDALYILISSDSECSTEMSSEAEDHGSVIKNDSDQQTDSEAFFVTSGFEMLAKAETSWENDAPVMNQPPFLQYGSDEDALYILISSDSECSTEMSSEAEDHGSVIKNDSDQQTDSEAFFVTSGFEMLAKAETSWENDAPVMNQPPFLQYGSDEDALYILISSDSECSTEMSSEAEDHGSVIKNDSDQQTDSEAFFVTSGFEMLAKAETSWENDAPVMNQPPFLQYGSDEDALYILISSDSECSTEMSSEAEDHGSVIKNDSDQQTDSEAFFVTSGFAFVPVKILVTEENSTENRPETMDHPTVLEDDNNQASSSSSVLRPSSFRYLGDPRRNVRMLDIHLMAVQKKAIPRHAACYLVRILFSKEIPISSSVGIRSQGCQSLDPNKMAAIREHLAAVFPNYDLSEHGEEWQACISKINSLIRNLCSRRTLKTVHNNGGPTKCKRDSNDERDGDDNAGSSQVSQQEAISETREHGNSHQNSRALPEGIQEPSTDGAAVSYETLEYLGDPSRNIQMPKSLLITAKEKSRPELSARYLIRNLFTEEVLISSVHGSLECGVYSLNANKINALREFLQDIYPTCDLSENGYDWKLCVMAMNSCIHSLRCDLERSTDESVTSSNDSFNRVQAKRYRLS